MHYSASTLLTIFGGRIDDIRTLLLEERLPERWESRVRAPWGLTMASFNAVSMKIELAVDERPDRTTSETEATEEGENEKK